MNKARLILLSLFLSMSFLLIGCNSSDSANQDSNNQSSQNGTNDSSSELEEPTDEYSFKMSVSVGETSTWFLAAEKFAEDVMEKSNGRIIIDIYPNNVLSGGQNDKSIELLVQGNTDFSYDSSINFSLLDEKLGVVTAPFLFKDWEEAENALAGEGGDAINDILRQKGVEPLGFGQNGFRQVTNNIRPIKSPNDLDGLKVRVPGIKMYIDLWTSFGADPVTMSFSELFTSLQQGVVDGQENPVDLIHSTKLYEVQEYVSMWNYSYDPIILAMNKKTFDSLHPYDQDLIREAATEANKYQIQLAREKENSQIEELKNHIEIYYPTEEELNAFKEAVEPIYEQYESIWGKDLLDAFRAN